MAEILARNASIEAANGMQHHKGTMVVAYELHQLATELAKIAREMREAR
jgi:methyl-accepting chemotaxis protein